MIKAILFDMDGTITNSEALHREAFNILLRKYKIFIHKKQWQRLFIGTGSRFIAQWHIKKYHLPLNLDEFVDTRRRLYQQLLKQKPVQPIAGFMQFYQSLKKAGYKIAIASSGQRSNVLKSLAAIHVHGIPVVGIEQVHFRKPNPEIYLKAANMLGVRASECLVFEDSVVGVAAAKRARMKVVALLTTTPRKSLERKKPTRIVRDYRSVSLKWIRTL